ncbi:ribonuclease E/G family protein, partial [Chlamydia psittaci 06-1683]
WRNSILPISPVYFMKRLIS